MTEGTENVTAAPSPGQILSAARKSAGKSVAEIAQRMNLTESVIDAIEQDDQEKLPSVIFVRGYLRSYAKILGCDQAEVIEAFDALGAKKPDSLDMQSFSRRTSTERSNSRIMWITYLIIVVLIGFVVLWWWQKDQTTLNVNVILPTPSALSSHELEPSHAPAESQASSSAFEQSIHTERELPPLGEESDNAPAAPQLSSEAIQTEQPQAKVSATDALPAPESELKSTVAEEAEVQLTFNRDCWIKVVDATGTVVAEGVKTPSRTVVFKGQPPFDAIFGAPDAVQVVYQGEPMPFIVKDSFRPMKLTIPRVE